jgi:hypothetical protein
MRLERFPCYSDRSSMRLRPALSIYGLALFAASMVLGCPRQPDAPDPLTGTRCEDLADCNAGRSCGALTLCVDGFCEEGASLVRPCPGGEPVAPPDP